MKCQARKSNGQSCQAWAIRGATVCRVHGGRAPQVKRKATVNLAMRHAQRMVELAGVDMDPIAHLLDSLYRAAQQVQVWGLMVATLDDTAEQEVGENGWIRGELGYSQAHDSMEQELVVRSHDRLLALTSAGEAKVHPYVAEYNQALERRARFAKMCLDVGVAERQVRLVERAAEQLTSLFEQALAAIEGLTVEQRAAAAHAYSQGLARLEAPAVQGSIVE